MRVKIWGTRGSRPVSANSIYGTDTSCVEVRLDNGNVILLDAGSGLAAYAKEHPQERPVIFLTHLHLDHIQGLPFYEGLFDKKQTIYTPDEALGSLFNGSLSPIRREDISAHICRISTGERLTIGQALIETIATNHPGGCLAYKITADGWTFAYTGDHELPLQGSVASSGSEDILNFMAGADVVLVDAHFGREDHMAHEGCGHSDMVQWPLALAHRHIGQIVFTHFNGSSGFRVLLT